MAKRCRGFVVGFDKNQNGQTVWKVRIKDDTSLLDGQKLAVASIHDNLELARGLNVTFVVGSVDDEHGLRVPRAVDVAIEPLTS